MRGFSTRKFSHADSITLNNEICIDLSLTSIKINDYCIENSANQLFIILNDKKIA